MLLDVILPLSHLLLYMRNTLCPTCAFGALPRYQGLILIVCSTMLANSNTGIIQPAMIEPDTNFQEEEEN